MERQNNSEKNKTGKFILSDFNAGKAPVIKDNMVLAGQTHGYRTEESPEVQPHRHSQPSLDKG